MEYNMQFDLLLEYINFRVQLTQYSFELGFKNYFNYYGEDIAKYHLNQIPSFSEFCDDYKRYNTPHFKESYRIINDRLIIYPTGGLGTPDGIAHRYYNYFLAGVRYYINGNSDFKIDTESLNKYFKNGRN